MFNEYMQNTLNQDYILNNELKRANIYKYEIVRLRQSIKFMNGLVMGILLVNKNDKVIIKPKNLFPASKPDHLGSVICSCYNNILFKALFIIWYKDSIFEFYNPRKIVLYSFIYILFSNIELFYRIEINICVLLRLQTLTEIRNKAVLSQLIEKKQLVAKRLSHLDL